MSARRIAREIAVIILPQLPKEKRKLEQLEYDQLIARSVQMLTDHARQCLADADAVLNKSHQDLVAIEIDHPSNLIKTEDVRSVVMNTGQLKEQIAALEIAVHLVSEALDLPEMAMASTSTYESVTCSGCGAKTRKMNKKPGTEEVRSFVQRLLGTYMDNKAQVDEFIANAKSKWKVERMVSIDRDILRLACTEAFFMDDIPINVAVSEAVELCHRFADERAAKFINGILGDMTEEAAAFRASSVSTVLQ